MGIHPVVLTNLEKMQGVDALKDHYSLVLLIRQTQRARRTYCYHKTHQGMPDKYEKVRQMIRSLFDQNYHCYGYRRISQALRHKGVLVTGESRAPLDG